MLMQNLSSMRLRIEDLVFLSKSLFSLQMQNFEDLKDFEISTIKNLTKLLKNRPKIGKLGLNYRKIGQILR